MSDPSSPSNLPSPPIDRPALERVLARAAELQARAADAPEGVSERQLIEIGKEVGLSEAHLRQALAEERTRVALPVGEEQGLLARVAGPRGTHATRTLRGRAPDVLAALDAWMQREECLVLKRRFADRLLWEPRRDIVGSIRRGFNFGGRGYHLARADDVGATVVPVDDGQVLVRLDASLAGSRSARVAGGGALLGAGTLAAATVAAVLVPAFLPLAALPVVGALGGAAGILRQQSRVALRVQLALEQVLDRLEHQEMRRPGQGLAEVLGAVIKSRV
ncbi:MAG: hypothetical protein ACJ79S_22000 [Gemmatimonadaceae bacterium]